MEQKRHEKIFLIVLVILAIAGIFFFSYRFWEDSRFLHEGNVSKLFEPMVPKGEAIELSKEFLNLNKFSVEGYDSALSFYSDDNAYSFLERNIGKREAIEYYKNNNLSFGSYDVRFFKELEIEEFFVGIDLESGRVVSFAHIIPEKEERQNLEKEEAREVVMSFLNSLNYDLQDFEEKDYSTQKIQNRTDHVFRFKLKGSELDSKYGEAYVVIYADVLGDKIGGFNYYLFVPEEFEREINKQLSSGIFLTILSYLATIFMFILAFIFLIKAFVNKKANWKSYLLLSLITLAILIVSTINEYPALKSFYTTDSPFLVHIGIAIAIGIIISILFVSTIFISGVSGDFLAKEVWKEKIKNTLKKLSPSIFRGYLIAFSSLGLVSLLYLIGERYLGVWALSSGAESYSFLLSFIPFISIFSIVFFAAFSEEIIYRLFGISFFKKYLKSTFFAILLSTLVWAVAHSSYPVFPFYFRAIELIIGGSIWGYFFVRYDLSTVISAHYVYNAVLFGSIMFFTGTLSLMISAVTLVLLPLILIPLNQFLIKRA